MHEENKINKAKAIQSIDEYNRNPHLCKFCGEPILAPYDKKLSQTKSKQFCSSSCAAKFNNRNVIRNHKGGASILDKYSDEYITMLFNQSVNLTDFSKKLGYKTTIHLKHASIKNRLNQLNLDITKLKTNVDISALTKKELFDRYSQWQTARSAITRMAREIFAKSNKTKQCIVCGYDKHYEVAHIKAVSDFDDNALISEINSINNLIALCPNHHWEYDNHMLDISNYISQM